MKVRGYHNFDKNDLCGKQKRGLSKESFADLDYKKCLIDKKSGLELNQKVRPIDKNLA